MYRPSYLVCIVIPTYNERESLPGLVRRIAGLRLPLWRLIIIDDNSPDATGKLADELASQYPIDVIHREHKAGLGTAYRDGFAHALRLKPGAIVQMDADLSHDPDDIPRLLNALQTCDVAIGSRYIHGGGSRNWSQDRKLLSHWANRVIRMLLRSKAHDLTSGYKAFTYNALRSMTLDTMSSRGYNFQIEVTSALEQDKKKIHEVPIIFTERKTGVSKFDFPIMFESARRVLSQAFRVNKGLLVGSLILILAAGIRLIWLSRGDALSDEVLYGFRAIGMLDFDFALSQPTPLQLFTGVAPWWIHLSFHDHPLLVFFVQHISMGAFGVNLWGMRIPSALFGIASVYLTYAIAAWLFSKRAGYVASALMASTVLMVYVSRVAIQESQVIFFILLSVYCFLRAQDDEGWYLGFGAAFGLGLLSKYTVGFLIVPLMLYLILFSRRALKRWRLYGGAVIALIIFLPSIIYNILLYREFGHFDFQFFYIFGQKVSYWTQTPGKEIGSVMDRLIGIPVNLWTYGSWVFAIITALGCITGLVLMMRRRTEKHRAWILLMSIMIVNGLLYLAIGSSPRFLTMIVPWLVIAFAAMIDMGMRHARWLWILVCAVIFWEGVYSYNSLVAFVPYGTEGIHYAKIHWDAHAWGFNELDHYLDRLTRLAYPQLTIPYKYDFLEKIKTSAVQRAKEKGYAPKKQLFVYDSAIADLASLWVLQRRALYESWPFISAENYVSARKEKGDDFYTNSGFTDIYFIRATDAVLTVSADRQTDIAGTLEEQLRQQGLAPEEIRNHVGLSAFKVYHIQID